MPPKETPEAGLIVEIRWRPVTCGEGPPGGGLGRYIDSGGGGMAGGWRGGIGMRGGAGGAWGTGGVIGGIGISGGRGGAFGGEGGVFGGGSVGGA